MGGANLALPVPKPNRVIALVVSGFAMTEVISRLQSNNKRMQSVHAKSCVRSDVAIKRETASSYWLLIFR